MPLNQKEAELYPIVERWVKRRFGCFRTAINRGLRYGRIDVIGVYDVGGDLSGEIEVVAIEVKRGTEVFASACGQTLGYSVYANRVYLADLRPTAFTRDEVDIAGKLGIGLIQIKGTKCEERLTSPAYAPIQRLQLSLLEGLALGRCQLCGCFIDIGETAKKRFSFLSRSSVKRAVESQRGLMWWNEDVAARKNTFNPKRLQSGVAYERRFLCRECVQVFFGALFGARP